MPRQVPTTLRPRIALKPAEEASSSRSKSAAVVPDVNTPSRTVRPPFRFFDPFSEGLDQFQPTAFKTPVRTAVATEFNSGERTYSTINPCSLSIRNLHATDFLESVISNGTLYYEGVPKAAQCGARAGRAQGAFPQLLDLERGTSATVPCEVLALALRAVGTECRPYQSFSPMAGIDTSQPMSNIAIVMITTHKQAF